MKSVIGFTVGRHAVFGIVAGLVLCLPAMGPGRAHAHRVMVFAWIDGNTVLTQSKFPGDRPVSVGDIIVSDADGNQLLKGKTDEQGLFSFGLERIPAPGPVTISLVAGMGHQASWTLTEQEVARAMGAEKPVPDDSLPMEGQADAEPAGTASPATAATGAVEPPVSSSCLTEAQVEGIVERSLDRKLSPVMNMLVTIQESMAVGVDDVVAGIGYILGLAGIAAYACSRGRKG
ncbi:MAG: hypothetical protein SWC96_08320 [Thermodesulfobacteriota bacterium]|nr:hypothetical protein [Thermodesulfobacteriota bacterium]